MVKSPSRAAAPARIVRGKESIQAQLRRLYPTHEVFEAAIKAYGSLPLLADQLEINRRTLQVHKKWLDDGAKPLKKRTRQRYKKNSDLDEQIKKMADYERQVNNNTAGYPYTDVRVYKLTSEYVPGQRGTEGLIYLRTETSRTALPWCEASKRKRTSHKFEDEF